MLLNFLLSLMAYRFLLIFVGVLVFMISVMLPKKYVWIKVFGALVFVLTLMNLLMGSQVSSWSIYKHGETGTGTVVSQRETGDIYNDEPVIGYNVLLETADGQMVETSFESWDFNLYPRPEGGRYNYPEPGVEFAVKYLPQNPNRFVILSDKPSEYSEAANCQNLKTMMEEAERKMNFAKENQQYRSEYESAKEFYENAGCEEI